ncbi:phosphatidylglycerophosphatase, putative [Ketogulonicigenium vulgare Y25]|uniref:phosphatidylglycerophosphatase A family protein n=1 Tax=Ketogulonicigenium vulgare TaxID=92945 RepID=UPI0001E66D18|nr:phosphatidylglycerophosphatase A [Ketogulonicigenium vulgare]ADO42437.1 phosphatidylglycerophosphatase, putative [Ketogulonicigenium vulgare Y25]
MSRLIATVFYIGLLRPAPGTWGSAAAVALAYGGLWLILAATVALFFIGLWAAREQIAASGDNDPSFVVIDEVVGQWIALWPVFIGGTMAANRIEGDILRLWPGFVAGFILFRLFDIWKPGPIGKADRRGDALGLMLDDVIAGVFAGLIVILLAALSHGLMILL